jgi:glutamine synthetase
LRICPVTSNDPTSIAKQYNFEFRAADAAASPHLALAAIIHAGAQGIEDNLPKPDVTQDDLSLLSEQELTDRGFIRLPQSLSEALERFEQNDVVRGWFGEEFANIYLAHKRGELDYLKDMSEAEICAVYETVY